MKKYKQEYNLGYVFNKDMTKVYLIEINKPGKFGHGVVNGIGGKVDEGESPLNSMRREFNEEAGQLVTHWKFLGRYTSSEQGYIVYTYMEIVSESYLKEYNGPEGICKWYDLNNLPDNLSSNVITSIHLATLKNSRKNLQFLIYDGL